MIRIIGRKTVENSKEILNIFNKKIIFCQIIYYILYFYLKKMLVKCMQETLLTNNIVTLLVIINIISLYYINILLI